MEACLLYGSETWVLTRQLEKRLRAFQGSVLRVVLGNLSVRLLQTVLYKSRCRHIKTC